MPPLTKGEHYKPVQPGQIAELLNRGYRLSPVLEDTLKSIVEKNMGVPLCIVVISKVIHCIAVEN